MKIGTTGAGMAAVVAALACISVTASAQEGAHGAMPGMGAGHAGHAAAAPSPAADSKTVDLWVCASDETTGLSWEAPCPLDGKPPVKKTVERSSFTDLKNAKCPIMGGDTDANVFALYKGKAVHFCCPGCTDGFFKDPAGHIATLEKGAAPPKAE